MSTQIVIIGAGGFAGEVVDVIEASREAGKSVTCRGLLVDPAFQRDSELLGMPILGGLDLIPELAYSAKFICAVGAPEIRLRLVERAMKLGATFATVVHPHATVTSWVTLGRGVVVTAGARLTNRIEARDHVHLNLNSTVGHDCTIDDFVTASPGVHVSGGVHIGAGAFLGTGAVVLEKLTVGAWARIGAGSVVTQDVPSDSTWVGVPARQVKQREPGWHIQS